MADQSFEENVLRMRLQYLRNEFSDLLCRKNEVICHEENLLNIRYLNLFGQKQYDVYCLKLDIAMLKTSQRVSRTVFSNNRIPDFNTIGHMLCIDSELASLDEETLKLETEKQLLSDEVVLCQLWKPDSLN